MGSSIGIVETVIIGVYFTLIMLKGLRHSKDINHQDDFLVAGRNVGWFALLATMGATIVGGGFSIGAIGETYEIGVAMILISAGGYLQLVFSGKYIAPVFRKANLYTVAGYIGHRYDEKTRFLSFILSLLFSIGVLAAQMVAFGAIIHTMIPEIPQNIAVIIGAAMVIIYSTAGGLHAVISTDLYQFIILIVGFTITVILCVPELTSQPGSLTDLVPQEFFQIDSGKGILFLGSMFFAFLMGETFAPGYATRFCVGKDLKQTRKGIMGAGLFLMVFFPIVIFFIALFAKIQFPDIDGENALPKTILFLNNPVIGGVIIAALMSAVMSSADSILNSATAIFTKDFWEHMLHRESPELREGIRIARITSVSFGVAGVLLAIAVPNVIDLLLLTYTLWAPGMILPVVLGVFTRKWSPRQNWAIFATMIISFGATLWFMNTSMADTFQPSVFGVGVSLVSYTLLMLFLPRDRWAKETIAIDSDGYREGVEKNVDVKEQWSET